MSKRRYPFLRDPDNFIGVTLSNHYYIGNVLHPSAEQYARDCTRRNFKEQVEHLASYFQHPHISGLVRERVQSKIVEETSRRGTVKYTLYSELAIEITEEKP